MTNKIPFRQPTKFCNRHNSTDGYTINGTDFWVMTSCTVDVGDSTTPYNVGQSTMIHGVAS
jgi:hypothetical protein